MGSQLGVFAHPRHHPRSFGHVREEGAVGITAIDHVHEPTLVAAGLAVQELAAEPKLLQGHQAEPVLFAHLFEGGLFFGGGAFGDFRR
ncbi:MAG: hypothetical protein NT154_40785, partial [Verrucomicrobia bacterium]|nr:hypothetical protein [Verrucomicrobiota bacterium]